MWHPTHDTLEEGNAASDRSPSGTASVGYHSSSQCADTPGHTFDDTLHFAMDAEPLQITSPLAASLEQSRDNHEYSGAAFLYNLSIGIELSEDFRRQIYSPSQNAHHPITNDTTGASVHTSATETDQSDSSHQESLPQGGQMACFDSRRAFGRRRRRCVLKIHKQRFCLSNSPWSIVQFIHPETTIIQLRHIRSRTSSGNASPGMLVYAYIQATTGLTPKRRQHSSSWLSAPLDSAEVFYRDRRRRPRSRQHVRPGLVPDVHTNSVCRLPLPLRLARIHPPRLPPKASFPPSLQFAQLYLRPR